MKNKGNTDLGTSIELQPYKYIEKVIKTDDLKELGVEWGDIFIKSFIEDESLNELPIIGNFIKLIKFGNSINKYFTAKKLYNFLFQLKDIPVEKRNATISKINSSGKYRRSVGEQMFELLDKIENDGKPEILGKLFASVINEEIDYKVYLKAAHIIKTVFYFDLVDLKEAYDGSYINGWVDDTLMINGLIESNVNFLKAYETGLDFDDNGNKKESKKYQQEKDSLTDMGKLIIEIGMK